MYTKNIHCHSMCLSINIYNVSTFNGANNDHLFSKRVSVELTGCLGDIFWTLNSANEVICSSSLEREQ